MIPFDLASTRLLLSPLTHDQAPALHTYCQDPVLTRYIPVIPRPYTMDDAHSFVDFTHAAWEAGNELTWGIYQHGAADGEQILLGTVALRIPDADGDGRDDIGYWLGSEHRGHGYMAEAVTTVLDWAFSDANPRHVSHVGWECIPGNTASAMVAQKCGFTFLGVHPSRMVLADGTSPDAWTARIRSDDSRSVKPGWPLPS